jgi:hypothetical protein
MHAATATLALLVYTITRLRMDGLSGALLVGTAALAALFVLIERRSAHPLGPPHLMRSRSLIGGNLLILIAGMCVDGMLVTLTAYVQQVLGLSAVWFGLLAAVMTVTSAAGALCGQITALRDIPERDSGLGAGLADTSFALGTALGVAICTSVATTGHAFGVAAVFAGSDWSSP